MARGKRRWYRSCTGPGGEIGRRKGLKILWRATSVWVQVPPRAPRPRLSPAPNGATLPGAVENPEEISERECPVCLGVMALEERGEVEWLVCPNGCPTETE